MEQTDKMQKAKESFMKCFSFEKFKKIAKYMNCNKADYHKYLEEIEGLVILLLESYIFE